MAKPAKVKKDKENAAAAGNGAKAKAVGKAKAAPEKGKAKKQQAQAGGLKGRLGKAQTKAQPAKGKAAKPQGSKTVKFLREVRVELSKVTWPTREELIQSTIAVVIAVAVVGAYIAFFDFIFSRMVSLLSGA